MAYLKWLFSDRGMSQRGSGIVCYGLLWLLLVVAHVAIVGVFWGSPLVWLGLGIAAPFTFAVTMALWCEVTG